MTTKIKPKILKRRFCYLCGVDSKKTPLTYHSFPKIPSLLTLWMKVCDLDEKTDNVTTVKLCSNHFRPVDYVNINARQCGGVLRLKNGAVPCIAVPSPLSENQLPIFTVPTPIVGHEYYIVEASDEANQAVVIEDDIPFEMAESDEVIQDLNDDPQNEPNNDSTKVIVLDQKLEQDKRTRRRFYEPRYVGDVRSADGVTKRFYHLATSTIESQKRKIKALAQTNRRLRLKVDSLKRLVTELTTV